MNLKRMVNLLHLIMILLQKGNITMKEQLKKKYLIIIKMEIQNMKKIMNISRWIILNFKKYIISKQMEINNKK